MGRLDGRCAIVTGAGSGIGRATARLFAEEGARVVAVDVSETGLAETANGVSTIETRTLDAADEAGLAGLVAECVSQRGGLHAVYANAGIPGESKLVLDLEPPLTRQGAVVGLDELLTLAGTTAELLVARTDHGGRLDDGLVGRSVVGLEGQLVEAGGEALRQPAGVGEDERGPMLIDELESHAHDDPDHLYFLFHGGSGGVGDVFGNYANPEFDAVVEDAPGEPEAVRRPLIHRAQDILAEDIPVIALYYPAGRIAYRPDTYDGWWSDEGHGVFTKRSFLAGYADVGNEADVRDQVDSALEPIIIPSEDPNSDGGGDSRAIVGVAIASIGAAAAVGFGFLRRRGNGGAVLD